MKQAVVIIAIAVVAAVFCLVKLDCAKCDGDGQLEGVRKVTVSCGSCGGSGISKAGSGGGLKKTGRSEVRKMQTKCVKCRGKGSYEKEVSEGACSACSGTGKTPLYSKLLNSD